MFKCSAKDGTPETQMRDNADQFVRRPARHSRHFLLTEDSPSTVEYCTWAYASQK